MLSVAVLSDCISQIVFIKSLFYISDYKNRWLFVTVTLSEEIEEFKLLSIDEEPLVCASGTFTARDAVLQRCCQLAPISFSEAFSTR
jgi:hypothetical protein